MAKIKRSKRRSMAAGAFYIPKRSTEKPLGDDAHFVCEAARTIGVADSVGGWSRCGVDAGVYARELMDEAYVDTNAEGTSTACILTLDPDDVIRAANVGDSGFAIIRRGRVLYRSPVQQSRFNCPFQLGKYKTSYDPTVAHQIQIRVRPGDVIVMGTDEEDLEDLVAQQGCSFGSEHMDPTTLAQKIASYALNNAENKTISTPFALEARLARRLCQR